MPWLIAAVAVVVVVWALIALRIKPEDGAAPEPDLRAPFGYAVTEGAAPGYLADTVCATCHLDLYTSYQHVGMARSFARPRPEVFIEDFDAAPYLHPASQRYYEMQRRGDGIVFKRYQLDDDGQPLNVFERQVDWIVGSGNKTRSYLYQTEAGELFELPLGWYAQDRQWRMAPGYDSKNHPGIQRQVRRECMFCHNAYPDVPAGSDTPWQPHLFPKQLPEGTGCQRCHGPGAEHVRTVLRSERTLEDIRAAIVNPARLAPERRDAVCFQCHLLPTIALIGVRRADRPDYSFRPGQALTDYLVHVDVDEEEQPRADRFEINHQAYRLRQSACFQQSAGALTCITCHNPHRKVPPEERVTHYGAVCLGCHESHAPTPPSAEIAPDDCVGCHMPRRRTQDVVHVVMTDHKIQRRAPGRAERLAPLEETEPTIEGIDFLMPEQAPSGALGEVYKAVTLLKALTTPDAVDHLEQMLAIAQPEETTPYFYLAQGQIRLRRFEEAEQTFRFLLEQHPNHPIALQGMGIACLGQGQGEKAEALFRQALDQDPELAEVHANLGLLLTRQNRLEEAVEHYRQALAARPTLAMVWLYLAEVSVRLNRLDEAVEQYQRALEIDPSNTRAYLGLAHALVETGDRAEARRFLKHGLKVAAQPESIAEALADVPN